MDMDRHIEPIYERLNDIPLFDAHTHMDAGHIGARGLHDVLLYHMVVSDLYCAGCPDGARLSEDPSEDEVAFRMERALPYLRHIRNTSCYWGVRIILRDLYGWDEPVDAGNWRKLHDTIRERSKDPCWSREILRKANIKRTCTELWRGRGGIADEVFQYSLEWAFFTRCQWGQFDTALLELENAWGQDEPGAPLPVTLDKNALNLKKRIESVDDVKAAVRHYLDKIPYDRIISTASHLSTDISYARASDAEMEEALAKRDIAGARERDVYANYINDLFLGGVEAGEKDITMQFSLGAEPLPHETGSKLRTETAFELASLFESRPGIRFSLFLSSAHQNQTLCTICRELPNVSLAGYWWHNFFPHSIRNVMSERLDMLAANKQVGFFSDAYCAEWAYAKSIIMKKQLASVLADRAAQGQYTIGEAAEVARLILYETPRAALGMRESEGIA